MGCNVKYSPLVNPNRYSLHSLVSWGDIGIFWKGYLRRWFSIYWSMRTLPPWGWATRCVLPVSRKDVRSPLLILAPHTLQNCSETLRLSSGSQLFLAPNSIMPRLWFCRMPSKTGRAGKHQARAPSRRRSLMLRCQSRIDPRWNSTGAPGFLECGFSTCHARGVPAIQSRN